MRDEKAATFYLSWMLDVARELIRCGYITQAASDLSEIFDINIQFCEHVVEVAKKSFGEEGGDSSANTEDTGVSQMWFVVG